MDCFVGSHKKLLGLSSIIAHVLKRPWVKTLLTPYTVIYGAFLYCSFHMEISAQNLKKWNWQTLAKISALMASCFLMAASACAELLATMLSSRIILMSLSQDSRISAWKKKMGHSIHWLINDDLKKTWKWLKPKKMALISYSLGKFQI